MVQKIDLKKNLFPFDRIREEQDRFISDVIECLKEKKHLIAHAPTGIGKTAILGPALAFALKNKKTVFFLTSRHTQHIIAIETLKDIQKMHDASFTASDIIGKKWMCAHPGTSALFSREFIEYCKELREHDKCEFCLNTYKNNKITPMAKKTLDELKEHVYPTEKIVDIASEDKLCPYEVSLLMAKESAVVICDYAYVFDPGIRNMVFRKIGKKLDDSIIIVDEAHNLAARIRELLTTRVSNLGIKRAVREAKKFRFDEVVANLSHLQDILNDFSKDLNLENSRNERVVGKDEFVDRVSKIKDYDELIADFEFAAAEIRETQKQSSLGAIAMFLSSWQGEDEGFVRIIRLNAGKREPIVTLSYRSLDPTIMTKEVVEDCHSMICMSGTLTPTHMYRDLLGFGENAVEKQYMSPFPKKNKLSLIVPKTTTKFSMRNSEQYRQIAGICADIVNIVPGNSAVFFPSYFLRDSVYRYFNPLCNKKVILEKPHLSSSEKKELLKRFRKNSKAGAALLGTVSGSFGEGIDLPGSLLKCVVVIGLPLQKPDLETKALIDYYEKKFGNGWDYGYVMPALTRAFQAAGRCIRSETDKGIVVFLDQRYAWPKYFKSFPLDMDVKISDDYRRLIEGFFDE